MQKYKILFIGLGTMGFNMATFLAKSKKYDLHIYNRTKNIQQKWLKKNFAIAYNFDTEIKFDFIITCVKDDTAIDQVLEKIIKKKCFNKSSILVDHSTISFDQVSKIKRIVKSKKFKFADAPITMYSYLDLVFLI